MSATEENDALIALVEWIDLKFSGIELPTDERSMLATGCFDVALEHQAAIALLFRSGLYGSMFALLRVLTESLVRGLWLLHSATDIELSKFKLGKIDKKFDVIVSEVEISIAATTLALSNLKSMAWKSMNGFTHTGFNQVARRHSLDSVSPNYPESELSQSQTLAGALGLLAASQLGGLSKHPELVDAIVEQMRIYSKKDL